jgi:hypothetical protein
VHQERGEYAAGDGGGVVQAAEGVCVHLRRIARQVPSFEYF